MEDIYKLMDELQLNNHLTLEEIPDLDLYMDQVIQLFERKYAGAKRNEKEKVLTKTMINNYAKGKLFFPITNKKYSRDHLLLISLIYQLKGALSIGDIKTMLDELNRKIVEEEFDLDAFYERYLHVTEKNVERVQDHIQENTREVREEIEKLDDQDDKYLEQVLDIASFVHMSNMYRRMAERLVDQMSAEDQEK
ncbi:DUF1836 domain-containing protein [Salinibacillus xinjiangensis]|uniref:DUF1836 domain-containing protein n=1 Tax=Salinibacillus xinjiangensis TaxID=1229268 RepID=A0A6G1X296_9BACI|nr:DUF1836 domain-containing protein [Salinibacillus xinjiangensis]MRG85111.1 DUF1836 domain-containing protein [Salinibacillus xinjiangensis]